MPDAGDGGGAVREGGDGGQGDGLVGTGGHIHRDAGEFSSCRRYHQNALGRVSGAAAHLNQNVYKVLVTLQGVEMYLFHQYGNVQKRTQGIEIACGGHIGFNGIVQSPAALSCPGEESAGGGAVGADAELFHHLQGHFNIGHAVGALHAGGKIPAAQAGRDEKGA